MGNVEMEAIPVTLAMLAEGVAGEKFNRAFRDLLNNIRDPNTDATAKRKITLELVVTPHADREQLITEVVARVSFAPLKKSSIPMHLSVDGKGVPEAIAFDFKKNGDPRQGIIPLPTQQQAGNQ